MGKLIDLTGMQFGKLTVMRREGTKNGQATWLCQCECEKETVVTGSNLRNNHTTTCGSSVCRGLVENLLGQTFGKLKVVERSGSKNNYAAWLCQCTCGKTVIVRSNALKSYHTKSCGSVSCGGKRSEDLTNCIFGKLTVVEKAGTYKGSIIWRCRCECKTEVLVSSSALRCGHTKSCGCVRSYTELQIANFLRNWQVSFQQEQTFPGLVSEKGGFLRFDFAFYNQQNELLGLLEYHGEQHYDKNHAWHTPEGEIRDDQKQVFAREKGIPIITLNKHSNLEADLRDFLVSIGALTT